MGSAARELAPQGVSFLLARQGRACTWGQQQPLLALYASPPDWRGARSRCTEMKHLRLHSITFATTLLV